MTPQGFGSINFGTQGGNPLVFTLSEPWFAHTWWPAKEDNFDKATGELKITVPDTMTVASNGLLLTVVNVHLENTARPSGRRLQLAAALDAVAGKRGPVLLAGDLNTAFGPLEGALVVPERHGFTAVALHGLRRLAPRVDRAFVRRASQASGEVLDLGGSDHRPLLVRATFSGQST